MRRLVRRLVTAIAASLIIFALLFVSFQPSVAVQSRPSTDDIRAARQVWQQLTLASGRTTEVRVDRRMASDLSAIAREATGVPRLEAVLAEGELRARASISLPLGLWINTSASVTGRHEGFPPFRSMIGRVPVPPAAGRLLADLVRWVLRFRGATIPNLNDLVERISIEPDHVLAQVKLPSKTGMVDGLLAASGRGVSQKLVEATYCRIAAAQQKVPLQTLPGLVRRAFSGRSGANPADFNRAAFVALSLAVVGERAEPLLPKGTELRRRCPFPKDALRLQGRADLAKHWVLSAGLTAVLGPQAAENLGEWKELDDSRADGSGFSFVDLAADRAGVQTAILAVDPQTSAATKEQLGRATDEYMLPYALLEAPEGLSSASFAARFGTLERKRYREAIFQIDRILAQQRGQPN